MYNLISSHQPFRLIIYSHCSSFLFPPSFQKAVAKITCNSFFPNKFGKKLLQYGSMEVWENGNLISLSSEIRMDRGFQRTVNEMYLFEKNISTPPYFHTPILSFRFSKFFLLFNKLTFAHQNQRIYTLTPSLSHTCFRPSNP